jgi:hypothetical protein
MTIFFSCRKENSCANCSNYNKPPIANAGPNQIITLPTNTISLDGSYSIDPDNNISSYSWTQISGPSSSSISDPNAARTTADSLVQGVYEFKLTVTDKGNLFSSDTIKVIVYAKQNEIIIPNLTWFLFHSSNDPTGAWDEITIGLNDTSNAFSNPGLKIFLKLQSSNIWIPVTGACSNSFYLFMTTSYLGSQTMYIEPCPLNYGLIGTQASVKFVF